LISSICVAFVANERTIDIFNNPPKLQKESQSGFSVDTRIPRADSLRAALLPDILEAIQTSSQVQCFTA